MKKIPPYIYIFLSLTMIVFLQFSSDREKLKVEAQQPIILDASLIRSFDLGLHNAAADFAWLSSIQYYGNPDYSNYSKLKDYLDLTVTLDPQFVYPYSLGTLLLSSLKQTDKAIGLAQRGIDSILSSQSDKTPNPDAWQIPYYLGTVYHIYKDDPANAAKYLDLASETPGAPENIKIIAANYGSRQDKRQQTIDIWTGIYETTKDQSVKDRAEAYITHFEILNFLDKSVSEYQAKFSHMPASLDDLITGQILIGIPPDPLGTTFSLTETGQVISQ
ncbi:MAG: hypothetical protein WCO23_03090 [bacterium]